MLISPPNMPVLPPQGYAAPPWPGPSQPRPAASPSWQQPSWQDSAQVRQPSPRAPVVRAKGEDDPAPARPPVAPPAPLPAALSLPSPEQLGVARGNSANRPVVDWGEVQQRLDRLGAISLHQQKLLDGGYRVTCVLPAVQGGRNSQVQADGENLAQAIGRTLDRAENAMRGN